MELSEFIDYYEVMQISPNANSGTLERMYRYLAQLYHPDNPDTGDRLRFDLLLEANTILKDPVKRAQYDIAYKQHAGFISKLAKEVSSGEGIDRDVAVQEKLLATFYAKRRRSLKEPGVADFELERLFDCPVEHLEFHLWYLKEKGWIARTDTGMYAITIDGVDRASSESHRRITNRLLTDQSSAG